MRQYMPKARLAVCAGLGALSALSFAVSPEGYVGRSAAPAASTSYLFSALALCFALLFWWALGKRGRRLGAVSVGLGLLFGVVNTLGGMLFAYDSWAMLGQGKTLALTLLRCVGQGLPMMAALEGLHGLLTGALHLSLGAEQEGTAKRTGAAAQSSAEAQGAAPSAPGKAGWLGALAGGRPLGFLRRHETLGGMLLLILCWSPYLLIYYPGTVCWDLGEMAAQFFGLREMDTWHPVFLTWIFGGCIWLGRLLGSDNLGAALFMLLQTLALAYGLAQALGFLRRCGTGRGARLGALAFFALTPFWGGYAQFISKDTLYVSAVLLFTLRVADILLCREKNEKIAPRTLLGLFAWGLLCCLCRSNGLYVVAPTALLLGLWGARGRQRLPLIGALAGAVCGALLFSHGLVPALGIKDETASGVYSVCFQQSARVLRDHREQVTPEEYEEIDRVLDAEKLPQLYEPWISDPVKYTFRFYGQGAAAEKAALGRYQSTWAAMLGKYPLTYAEAFFAGNVSYYTFMPKFEGASYNNQAGNRLVFETFDVGKDPAYVHTTHIGALEGARTLLAVFARGWRHIPLLGLLYSCALYTWTLVGAGASLARRRQWRVLIAFVPALLSLGVCLLSPVNDYFRYFLPVVAVTPPLLGLGGRRKG